MTSTTTFLKARHWHLFLLTFGIPMIFQFVMMGVMVANIPKGWASVGNGTVSSMFNFFKIFPVVMMIFTGTIFGWFWSIAIGLQDKVPANIKMKTKKFKIFFFIPVTYTLLIAIVIGSVINSLPGMIESGNKPNLGLIGSLLGIIIPLHLFSIFCIFYSLYFVAKTFKTVELQRETAFSDFAGEFCMIWFYPIGIWIIQPKVNKMADNSSTQ